MRVGKLTLAAPEATLRLYLQPEKLAEQLPTLRLLTRPQLEMQQAAERLLAALTPRFSADFELRAEPCWSQIGSGSLPVDRLPSYALTFTPRDARRHAGGVGRALAPPAPAGDRPPRRRPAVAGSALSGTGRGADRSAERLMIIATAGHVDHGKTTLLQAISGINADRLPEKSAAA